MRFLSPMRLLSPATARQKYWLGLSGSFAFGLFLKLLPHLSIYQSWPIEWQQLASEMSNAFIIAAVLAFVVDQALKEELLTEFAKDVSCHIIGNLLPLKLREHLRHYLEMSLVRESWNITYNLKPLPPYYVEVTVLSDYEMENRSSDEQPFEFVIKVEKSWFTVGQNLITMVKVHDHPKIDNPPCVEESGHWVHRQFVKLPPYDKDNPQRIRFHAQAVQYFFESAFSPFISVSPVLKATVTVTYPKDIYEVVVDTTFRPRNALVPNDLNQGKQWEINEPILPGQGFFVRWSRKRAAVAPRVPIPVKEPAA